MNKILKMNIKNSSSNIGMNALDFFAKMAKEESDNPNCLKMAKNSDFSDMDADFILKYATPDTSLLDVGSGTGLIVNKIFRNVREITAIEPFVDFSKFIIKDKNIVVINKTSSDYEIDRQYDIVTCFGFCQYLDEDEVRFFYKKIYNALKDNGKIIIKNQFGIKEDVTVKGFSTELKKNYYAQYRYINKEIDILNESGYKNMQFFDIYPPECNRWKNTHFYAIVADKI